VARQTKKAKNISGDSAPPIDAASGWTFLTNHGHVLLCLAGSPEMRLRDVAERVGITERSVQTIVQELVDAGAISRHRVGRRNHYEIHPNHKLHHPVEAHCEIGDLIDMVLSNRRRRRKEST